MVLDIIAAGLGVIEKKLKKAEKNISKHINQNKKLQDELRQSYGGEEKNSTEEKEFDNKGKKLSIRVNRIVLKIAQWLLEFINAIIKFLLYVIGPIALILIIVTVLIVVLVGSFLRDILSTGQMDNIGIEATQTGQMSIGSLNWDEIVKKAEAMEKTGEFTNIDVNRIRAYKLAYELYNDSDTRQIGGKPIMIPEAFLAVPITESGFNFYNEDKIAEYGYNYDGKGNVLTDNTFYPQIYCNPGAAWGCYQIEYVNSSNQSSPSISRTGEEYKWGSYQTAPTKYPEFIDLETTSMAYEYPSANRSLVTSYLPWTMKWTLEHSVDRCYSEVTGETESRFDCSGIADEVFKEVGLENNEETWRFVNAYFYKLTHWRGGLTSNEDNIHSVFIIGCALYKLTGEDLSKIKLEGYENANKSSVFSYMADDFCNGNTFIYDDKVINKNIFDWVKGEFSSSSQVAWAADYLKSNVSDGNFCHYIGGAIFDMYTARMILEAYLSKMGYDLSALNGNFVNGSGPFGLSYYKADGSVDEEMLSAASATFAVLAHADNEYTEYLTVPVEVEIDTADGKKKVKIPNGGSKIPNFWGVKYNASAPENWGQCTWWVKGRAMLYLYENVGQKQEDWYIDCYENGYKKNMRGNGDQLTSSIDFCKVDNTIGANSIVSCNPMHTCYVEAIGKDGIAYTSHGNMGGSGTSANARYNWSSIATFDWGNIKTGIPWENRTGWGYSFIMKDNGSGMLYSGCSSVVGYGHLDKLL